MDERMDGYAQPRVDSRHATKRVGPLYAVSSTHPPPAHTRTLTFSYIHPPHSNIVASPCVLVAEQRRVRAVALCERTREVRWCRLLRGMCMLLLLWMLHGHHVMLCVLPVDLLLSAQSLRCCCQHPRAVGCWLLSSGLLTNPRSRVRLPLLLPLLLLRLIAGGAVAVRSAMTISCEDFAGGHLLADRCLLCLLLIAGLLIVC